MSTPYCTAVRLARRAVDEVRAKIGEAQEEVASLDGRAAVLRAIVASERSCLVGQLQPVRTRWFDRTAAEQLGIEQRQACLVERLAVLRDEIRRELAALRAVEQAAEGFRSDQLRRRAWREQSAADDRAAALWRNDRRAQAGPGT